LTTLGPTLARSAHKNWELFQQMTNEEMVELQNQVRDKSLDGRLEWFKSTQFYDSGYHRDQHGFPSIGHVSGNLD